ncbi:MAG: ribulose-phosphate 3-epimerase [Defluviitaleaceae bacterium]|nr:ribulose-phosphate 3-epimerase [Defluviitaleaceae bacterium]
MIKLAPSILAADFAQLGDALAVIDDAGAQYVHLDVMDGHFVPNISFGVPVIESLRKEADRRGLSLVFDAHLMIANPKDYIEVFAKAGADIITFHLEACGGLDEALEIVNLIHCQGKKAGVAVNPGTPACGLLKISDYIEMGLIMSVEPGFGGQGFIEHTLEKVSALRAHAPLLDIQIDGGIGHKNIQKVVKAGANVIVAGSAVFGADDVYAATKQLMDTACIY